MVVEPQGRCMKFKAKFLNPIAAATENLNSFLKRVSKIEGIKIYPPGSTPPGYLSCLLMPDGRWLCGDDSYYGGDGEDRSVGHPALAEAVGGESELLQFNPVRVVSNTEFDFIGKPTEQQRREVLRFSGNSIRNRLTWDLRSNTGERLKSGSGTLGDMLRDIDKTYGVTTQKTAWQVGKSIDRKGHKVHVYLWVDSPESGLIISDEYPFHIDLAMDEGDLSSAEYGRCKRGMIILYPELKKGDVFMYENQTVYGISHGDAAFIDNDIWRELVHQFKGYKLEEKQGLSDAVSSGACKNSLPIPLRNNSPVYAAADKEK